MGSCGCGDFAYDDAYQVGKNLLAVQVYQGCGYCDTPIGVVLHLMTPKEAKNWDATATEKFDPGEDGYADLHIPVIHPEDLIAAARSQEFRDEYGDLDLTEYDNLADVLKDCGPYLLQIATDLTLGKWRKEKPATPDDGKETPNV